MGRTATGVGIQFWRRITPRTWGFVPSRFAASKHRLPVVVAGLGVTLVPGPAEASKQSVTTTVYDIFDGSESDYAAKWDNPYGSVEMAAGGTPRHDGSTFRASALPFRTGADFSFYHFK